MTSTEYVELPSGQRIPLLLTPSPPEFLARFKGARPSAVIPSNEIPDFDLWPAFIKIRNQGSVGACNSFASTTAVEFTRAMNGLDFVELSPWFVYGRLVNGWDVGSNIGQALTLVEQEGIPPNTEVRWGDYSGKYSESARTKALNFRVEIGNRLETWNEILTAVALRRGVNLSVCATAGWSGRLDSNGCPPVGRGPGNHAVMCGGGIKTLPNGERCIKMCNSWGVEWGAEGHCWLTRAHFEEGTWREAFEVVTVVTDELLTG